MAPLILMVVTMLLARGLGAAHLLPTTSWIDATWMDATRVGLAIMFLFTASAHFTSTRRELIQMVPPLVPGPDLAVTLTGFAEIAGAIGLLIPWLRPWAGSGLIPLLVAMFPANMHAARAGVTFRGRPATRLRVRLPVQILWILLLWWSSISPIVATMNG